jgi:hypothetical protein
LCSQVHPVLGARPRHPGDKPVRVGTYTQYRTQVWGRRMGSCALARVHPGWNVVGRFETLRAAKIDGCAHDHGCTERAK